MMKIGDEIDGPRQAAVCGAHGDYVSTWWTMPMPRGSVSSWTGCPVCVREREQQKRGYGKARFKYPHRSSYEVLTITDGIERRFVENA